MSSAFIIKDVRVSTMLPSASAGTYFKPGESGHWLVDSLISNPMSGHPKYRDKRSSWGIGVLGSLVVEIETDGRHRRRRHRQRRHARRMDDPQPFRPLPRRRGCAQHQSHLGRALSRLPALWTQGAADHGDQRRRSGAVGSGRQGARRAGLQSDRRPVARRDHLLLHRTRRRRHQGHGVLGRQGAAARGSLRRRRGAEAQRRVPRRRSARQSAPASR